MPRGARGGRRAAQRGGGIIDRKMYSFLLIVHSWLRYPVLLVLLLVVLRCATGLRRGREWDEVDDGLGYWLMRLWDLQFLLGLVLYFLSPITHFAFANFGEAMGDRQLRVVTLEHPLLMLLATAALHAGWARARKSAPARARLLRWLIFVAAAALLAAIAIPWEGRPLLRISTGPLQL